MFSQFGQAIGIDDRLRMAPDLDTAQLDTLRLNRPCDAWI